MKRANKNGSVAFSVIFCAFTVFLLLPLFGVIAQKTLLYQKKMLVWQSVDLAVVAAYTSLDAASAGIGEQMMEETSFNRTFKEILANNLGLDDEWRGLADSFVSGQVEVVRLLHISDGLPATIGGRIYRYPYILCEIKVPVNADLFSSLLRTDYVISETYITELPFDK